MASTATDLCFMRSMISTEDVELDHKLFIRLFAEKKSRGARGGGSVELGKHKSVGELAA